MNLEEAQESLRKKGYPESEIDIWTAGYDFANTRPAREDGWTAVEDGLPIEYGIYLWQPLKGVLPVGLYFGAYSDLSWFREQFIAWRPMEPYKGDK